MICPPSDWIEPLAREEPLLAIQRPDLRHYIVATEDELLEVLTDAEPLVSEC